MIHEPQTKQLSFRIPESLHERIKRAAEREGISVNMLLTKIMRENVTAKEPRTESDT